MLLCVCGECCVYVCNVCCADVCDTWAYAYMCMVYMCFVTIYTVYYSSELYNLFLHMSCSVLKDWMLSSPHSCNDDLMIVLIPFNLSTLSTLV